MSPTEREGTITTAEGWRTTLKLVSNSQVKGEFKGEVTAEGQNELLATEGLWLMFVETWLHLWKPVTFYSSRPPLETTLPTPSNLD